MSALVDDLKFESFMHPILFQSNGLTVYAYGTMLALGFLLGIALVLIKARKRGISMERMVELFCLVLVSSVAGARVLYLLVNLRLFREDPSRIFKIWEGGLVFYGGVILAVPAAMVYIRRHRLSLWRVFDLCAPSLALGLFFARIGCFMAGCCYGKETSLPWGVVFTHPQSLARLHLSLHPTQLYEAAAGLVLFLFLIAIEKRKSFEGQIFWQWIFFYSVLRFLIEFIRGDPRGFLLGTFVSTSQGIGFILALFSLYMLFYLKRRQAGGREDGCPGGPEISPSDPEKAV